MNTIFLALVLLAAWTYLAGVAIAARRFARRSAAAAEDGPPVSVLKPLHGPEPGLHDNLASFADQDYPSFQVIFGVRERDDGALPAVRAVMAARPGGDIDLVVDHAAAGSNLKVANLENMLPSARHDIILLADSDMRVGPDYLAVVTAPLRDPAVGLVTCFYKAVPGNGLWSRLAALHINYGFLPGALVGEALDLGGGCFGATIALRRDVLQRIGGFSRLRNELADDHRMGAAVRRLGMTVLVPPYIVENRVTEPTFASLWRHELRWARTSRAMAPAGFAGSVLSHTVIVTALAVALWGSAAAWSLVAASLVLRWLSAAFLARRLGLPRTGLWLLPLRDALSFAVFVASFCGRSVLWRDQLFRVEAGGRLRIEGDKPV